MKINLELFAARCIDFAGMAQSKAAGLAELFRIVERESFCDGVRIGRSASFADDPAGLHDVYAMKPASSMGSRGGKARAEKLSKERRSEIASDAAKARWSSEAPPVVPATEVEPTPAIVAVPESS